MALCASLPEEKAILQANAYRNYSKTNQTIGKSARTPEIERIQCSSVTPAGSGGNQSIEALSIKCVELESYVIQIRKENIDLKSENISLKEKLVTATELGQDALRHAEDLLKAQSHTKTDEEN